MVMLIVLWVAPVRLSRSASMRPAAARAAGWTLRLAAVWECAVSLLAQDRDWIFAVELLLAATVDAEHAAARYRRDAPAQRARAAAHRFDDLLAGEPPTGACGGAWGSCLVSG
jgi:hypothetical protein